MVIFIDAFWCLLCFASMIVVYYVSIEASFIATFYPTIWRILHIHHASINTAIGHSWSYFRWLYALRKCLKDARFAWYSATYMECKQPTEKRFWQMCYYLHIFCICRIRWGPQNICWFLGRAEAHVAQWRSVILCDHVAERERQNQFYEYTLCVGSWIIAKG